MKKPMFNIKLTRKEFLKLPMPIRRRHLRLCADLILKTTERR
jgi:hypothetical protein